MFLVQYKSTPMEVLGLILLLCRLISQGGVFGAALFSTIFKLTVLDYFARLKLAFMVT